MSGQKTIEKQKAEFWGDIWHYLVKEKPTSNELIQRIAAKAHLRKVGLYLNHQCNLRCKHCFYGCDTPHEEPLGTQEWYSVIDGFIELGARQFHICGREPFCEDNIIDVLNYLNDIKNRTNIRVGIITNGTLVNKYLKSLSEVNIDYLEFSIDGPAECHDFLRGNGSYLKSERNLELAISNNLAPKISIASVANKQNYKKLPVMFDHLSNTYGVKNFFVQPMLPHGRAVKLKPIIISVEEYNELINRCVEMLMNGKNHTRIVLLVYPAFLPILVKKNSYVKESFRKYFSDHSSTTKINLSEISFRFHLLCMAHWQTCRITSDGYYLGCSMMMCSSDYREYAVGNVRQTKPSDLWHQSITNNNVIENIYNSYDYVTCKSKPCFELCHGGCRIFSNLVFRNWHSRDVMCQFH